MTGPKILVLGATGPSGICLLRELLYRNHQTVAYVRNPTKIPADLAANPLLEVIQGQMDDTEKLETAVAQSSTVLSLLGPNVMRFPEPSPFPGYYSAGVLPLMRKHGVRRILAMSTISLSDPQDGFSLLRWLMVQLVHLAAGAAYRTMLGIGAVFSDAEATRDIDWTVYRIAFIPGGDDEASWKKDREDGEVFAGYVAQPGWRILLRRAAMARWLVDAAESGAREWVGKMPAISKKAGGGHSKTS